MINRDRIIKTFCEIVAIDSPSGEEEPMAIDVMNRLENFGFSVTRDDYGNVIASDGRENPILLSAHLDTVEPGRGITPIVKDDQIVSDGTTILGGDWYGNPASRDLCLNFCFLITADILPSVHKIMLPLWNISKIKFTFSSFLINEIDKILSPFICSIDSILDFLISLRTF